MDINKLLDKAYHDKPLSELVKSPVDAIYGVSKGDAELLEKAFRIKTVGDFAKCKFVLAAQAITMMADAVEK